MMEDDDESIKDNVLGNISTSGNIENVVHLPITAELLVVSNDSSETLDPGKQLNLQSQTVLNVDGNYVITSLNGNPSSPGKYLTVENRKNTTLTFLEPPTKRQKPDVEDTLKKTLFSMQHSILERLESIEKKVEKINTKCQCLEEKVENMLLRCSASVLNGELAGKGRFGDLLASIPVESSGEGNFYSPITSLNSEASYPNGSWLGNPENEAFRVRCSISPKDLVSINETCNTPVKMALTLLDYLFDRETQACSNISGAGKHGKLQLDPVKIFGIRCHLMYMFGVTEPQWRRIKLNLDSKCRSAFRRKQRGMPLTVKGFREKSNSEFQDSLVKNEECNPGSAISLLSELNSHVQHSTLVAVSEQESEGDAIDNIVHQSDPVNLEISNIIHTDHGDIHVLHGTLEQLAQLKDDNQVEILAVAGGQH